MRKLAMSRNRAIASQIGGFWLVTAQPWSRPSEARSCSDKVMNLLSLALQCRQAQTVLNVVNIEQIWGPLHPLAIQP